MDDGTRFYGKGGWLIGYALRKGDYWRGYVVLGDNSALMLPERFESEAQAEAEVRKRYGRLA